MKVLPEALSGSYLPPSEIGRLVGDDVCAICLEPLRLRAQTIALCGHVFHRCCLNRCGDLLCPQCRQPIDELTGTRWGLFAVGTSVTICGLQNHVELNGTRCRVVEIHEASHRLEVRTSESGRLYRVRPENLVVGEGSLQANEQALAGDSPRPASAWEANWDHLQPGAAVQLTGLHMAHYNDRTAVVLCVDRGTGRCEIRLGDGSVKTIRAENLRVLSPRQERQEDPAEPGRITL
uniref:RING-type domain-containing protein n=1 Tax=Alexandrium catenella TaxID=2925 RepID=A0A7S1W8F7_ALECA